MKHGAYWRPNIAYIIKASKCCFPYFASKTEGNFRRTAFIFSEIVIRGFSCESNIYFVTKSINFNVMHLILHAIDYRVFWMA